MKRIWLEQYPAGVAPEVDINKYGSLKEILETSCRRFEALPAYSNNSSPTHVPISAQSGWAERPLRAAVTAQETGFNRATRCIQAGISAGAMKTGERNVSGSSTKFDAPISDSARQFADSWDPSRITLPEEQCRVHVSPYIFRGPLNLRIWEEKHPKTQDLVAIKMYSSTYEQTRTIWMDGRPHPGPNAPHTWMGFSTGRWDGDMFVVETTHLKQ